MTTLYAGLVEYEINTSTLTKHYDAGGQRVAVRNGASLNYLLNDHLGSTSVILKTNGALWGELRYSAWGETRYSNGSIVTDRQFTGQINDGDTGLYYYNARYYDPALHKFIQADTIVPDPNDPQTLNRYSYVENNPIKYTDPTGHKKNPWDACGGMGAGSAGGIAIAGAGTMYYGYKTGQAIADLNIDLTPPPNWGEQNIPDAPSVEAPAILPHPAPIESPLTDDYSSFATPRLEVPLILTAGDSRKLGNNMVAAGMARPPESAAHHIIPGGDRRGDFARGVLTGAGIDINDAANGVFLPSNVTSANPDGMTVHGGLNTSLYYDILNNRLRGLTDRQDILNALNDIRRDLQDGTFFE